MEIYDRPEGPCFVYSNPVNYDGEFYYETFVQLHPGYWKGKPTMMAPMRLATHPLIEELVRREWSRDEIKRAIRLSERTGFYRDKGLLIISLGESQSDLSEGDAH